MTLRQRDIRPDIENMHPTYTNMPAGAAAIKFYSIELRMLLLECKVEGVVPVLDMGDGVPKEVISFKVGYKMPGYNIHIQPIWADSDPIKHLEEDE